MRQAIDKSYPLCLADCQGYTLVELTVVLLIIGLLSSAVMRADAMIANAQVHSDVRKLEALRVAYFLYKDQYRHLPGEDQDRPGRFKTVLSTQNTTEGLFYDLLSAQMIVKGQLQAEIGEAFKATWGGSSGANYGLIAGQNQVCITQIDTGLAAVIEAKLDNDDQYSGDLRYTANGSQLCMLLQ